ncbi:MAG: glycosyltransferase family 39 protein [Chloroflexota bacterium]|nr:glycosyltransferase family 39 protein [Chloroflexota bacterium]
MDSSSEDPADPPPAPAPAGAGRAPAAERIRAYAPAVLALAAVVIALATQFAITQGSPIPGAGYGFVLAVLLFAAAAWTLAHPAARAAEASVAAPAARRPSTLSLRWELVLLAGVIGLAVFFRFFRFSQFPPGLWYDEAINGTDALAIIDRHHLTVWRSSNFGHSTIFFYLLIASFRAFGYTVFAFRMVPALAGLAAVVAFYFLARRLLGPVPALVATALLAVGRFPVTFSRISWEASLQPLLEIMAVYFLIRALETKSRFYFFMAGGSLAAGLYTYLGFRFVPVMIAFFLLYIAIAERRLLLRNVPGLAIYAASFAIVVVPLAQYSILHQDQVLARTRDVNIFKEIDRTHSYEPLWHNIRASVEMMNVRGDGNGRHNWPYHPMLDEVSAALLVLGLAVCAWSVRDWRKGSMAGWLVLALVPGALTISVENPSGIRAVGAIPPLFLVAGLAVAFLHRVLTPTRAGAALFVAAAVALVGGSAALNYHQLFDEQAHAEAVYDAFTPVYTDVGQLATREAARKDVYIAGDFYDHPAVRVLTRGKTTHRYVPTAQIAFPRSTRDVLLIIDTRDFGIIPTLKRLYPHLVQHDDVDPFGRTYFTSVTIPASDIAAAHALPLALHSGSDVASRPVSTSHGPPDRAWTQADLSGGPFTAVWDGYVWVASYPGLTSVTLSSPGDVAIEIDGQRVASGVGTVTSPPMPLSFGEHRVRLIAGVARPGRTSATLSLAGHTANAADVLYATTTGVRGFQVLFRAGSDFGTPPVQVTHVPFAVGALPEGVGSAEYRGVYDAAAAGSYGFAIEGGSSAQLFVDGALVVDNGGAHPPRRAEGTVMLAAGPHTVSLQYANPGPSAWALSLRVPGGVWQLADGSEFTPPAGPFVQPALVTFALDASWGSAGRAVPGRPSGVAVLPDGTVVTGSGDRLTLIAPDGSQRTVTTPVRDIGDLDTTADGRIVVLDRGARSLFVLDRSGRVLLRVDGAFASAAGVGVGGDFAYVASPNAGIIYKVSLATGSVVQVPISTEAPAVKAVQPSDVAAAPDGTLYIIDFQMQQLVITPDGVTSTKTRSVGGTGEQLPHLALSGRLVFVTDPLDQRIVAYDLRGKQRGAFAFPPSRSGARPVGIAVAPGGEIYTVDPITARVYRLRVIIPPGAPDLAGGQPIGP